jgi:hypothetical protein
MMATHVDASPSPMRKKRSSERENVSLPLS